MLDWVELKAELQVFAITQERGHVDCGGCRCWGNGGEDPDVGTSGRKESWDLGSGGGNRDEVIKDRNEKAM